MADILDTRFADKAVEIDDGRVQLGQDINLLVKEPSLKKIVIGVGWDLNTYDADALDLDVSLFMLDKNDKTTVDEDFVFYNQKETLGGGVKHGGDSRTGAGEGDDEAIFVDLTQVPFGIQKLVIALSIYRGEEKEQTLSKVQKSYVRIMNAETNLELVRFELDKHLEDHKETAVIIGSVNREGPKWHFTPLAEFVEGGLGAIATRYGCIIVQQ